MEKAGPYTVRLDEDAFVIDGPTGTFGDFFSKDQADGECEMMNGCYAASQAASPPTLHIGMGEPVAWMHEDSHACMPDFSKKTGGAAKYSIPLFANAHTKAVSIDQLIEVVEEWVAREANSTVEKMRADEYAKKVTQSLRALFLKLTQQP